MTRTLIILSLDSSDGSPAQFYYGNGLNRCGQDYIDELQPLNQPVSQIRTRLIEKGYTLNGAGFDYNAPIGEVLLVWIDSLHILTCENGTITEVETLRRHQYYPGSHGRLR